MRQAGQVVSVCVCGDVDISRSWRICRTGHERTADCERAKCVIFAPSLQVRGGSRDEWQVSLTTLFLQHLRCFCQVVTEEEEEEEKMKQTEHCWHVFYRKLCAHWKKLFYAMFS